MLGKALLILAAASLAAIPASADAKHRGKKHHHGYSKAYKKAHKRHARAYYGWRYSGDRYYGRRYVAYPRYYRSRYYGGYPNYGAYYGYPYYSSAYGYPHYGGYYGRPYYGTTIYIGRNYGRRYRYR